MPRREVAAQLTESDVSPRAIYDDVAMGLYDFHHGMLVDRVRTEAFLRGILATVRPGDVVVDIGTGSGVLSLFAALAGARQVYAIEKEPIVEVARRIAEVNGVGDRIEFLVGSSTDVELPELGDVLITETIGNAGFDEGILAWVADARSRLLKPGARLIPEELRLVAGLLELPREFSEVQLLSDRLYTFDLSPLRDLVVNTMVWEQLSPVSVVSEPRLLLDARLEDAPLKLSGRCVLAPSRDAFIHAVGVWFEAVIADGITLTNAPPNAAPSWDQGVIMFDKPLELTSHEQVSVDLVISGGGGSWRYQIETL